MCFGGGKPAPDAFQEGGETPREDALPALGGTKGAEEIKGRWAPPLLLLRMGT